MASSAREVNRPRGLQLLDSLRSNPGNVAPGVGRASGLGHQTLRLQAVHDTCRSTGRQSRGARKVRHSQLAIDCLGEVHDHRVLTRRETGTPHEVAVQKPWKDFHNAHERPPELFFVGGQRIDGHCPQSNLLNLATNEGPRVVAGTGGDASEVHK